MIINNEFDDYLNLLNYDLSNYKYIVFIGNSGSGKTSYINRLIDYNSSISKDTIVIDEIFDVFDYFKLIFSFLDKKQFIIASHISIKYMYLFRFLGKIKKIETDTNHKKIYTYLQNNDFIYSEEVVSKYIKQFSATYTDVDIILEGYNGRDFDEAFCNFIKFNKIVLSGNKNNK